ncbi:MAG: signal transduction protein, partial [Chitinophagaceae bacterium]
MDTPFIPYNIPQVFFMYDQDQLLNKRIRFAAILCSVIIIALLSIVEIGLMIGLENLTSLGENISPMPEEAALLFFMLSVSSILLSTNPSNKYAQNAIIFICIFVILVSFITLIDIATNYHLNWSNFIKRDSFFVNGIVIGRMANLGAVCFILASITQLLILKNKQRVAVYFNTIVLCIAYLILIGYLYGVPFFLGDGNIPMPWSSSLLFFILSIGLIFAAGKDYAPISFFIGNSTRAVMMRNLIPVIIIITLVQNFIDVYYFHEQSRSGAFFSGLIDIVKMTVLGLVISIVSKRVGNGIDTIIGELTLYKSKVNQLSQAVENSPVTIIISDLAGNILYTNKKFVEVSGYSSEEVIGKNPRILKSGHTSDAEYKLLWESIAQGKSWKGEFHNKHKKGSFYWESAAIYPIKNGEDEVVQFLAIKEDITEQKKVNTKLKNIAWQQSH